MFGAALPWASWSPIGVLKRLHHDSPVIVTFHTSRFDCESAVGRALLDPMGLDRKHAFLGDYLIATSREIKEHLMRRYNIDSERIEYIPGGVDTSIFQPGPRDPGLMEDLGLRPDDRVVLVSGRVDPVKGVDQAIRSFALVARWMANARMILRGLGWNTSDSRYSEFIISLIRKLRLEERVVCPPKMPHELMPMVYRLADVTLIPSLYESTCLTALESLACGTPVIASAVGGLPDAVDSTCGILVPPRDVFSMAEALKGLLEDEARRELLREAAVRRAQEYAWPSIARRIASIYERCHRP